MTPRSHRQRGCQATRQSARSRSAARALTFLLGLLIIAFAFLSDRLVGGYPGFGSLQMALLGYGVVLLSVALFASPSWNLRVLAGHAAVGIALASVEVSLELWIGSRYRSAYQIDDRVLHRLAPNSCSIRTRPAVDGGEEIPICVNERGFRDENPGPSTDKGIGRRVVVYGDSFAHGHITRWDHTFVMQFAGRLSRTLSTNIQAVNAGVNGYGPDQILVRMQDELPELRPELVVLLIFAGNDFRDLIRNRMFRLGADGTLLPNEFVLPQALRARFFLARSTLVLPKLIDRALARSGAVGKFVQESYEKERGEFDAFEQGDNLVADPLSDEPNIAIAVNPDGPIARYERLLMKAVLHKIQETVRAAGAPLLLVVVPARDDVCPECGFYEGPDSSKFPRYRPETRAELVSQLANELGLPCLNLFESFHRARGQHLYFAGDIHWNDKGQVLAAELVAARVVEQRLLPVKRLQARATTLPERAPATR